MDKAPKMLPLVSAMQFNKCNILGQSVYLRLNPFSTIFFFFQSVEIYFAVNHTMTCFWVQGNG